VPRDRRADRADEVIRKTEALVDQLGKRKRMAFCDHMNKEWLLVDGKYKCVDCGETVSKKTVDERIKKRK
jgi:PHP family Zn ribbon phosphoesterase